MPFGLTTQQHMPSWVWAGTIDYSVHGTNCLIDAQRLLGRDHQLYRATSSDQSWTLGALKPQPFTRRCDNITGTTGEMLWQQGSSIHHIATVPIRGDSGAEALTSTNLRCVRECPPATHGGGDMPSLVLHSWHRCVPRSRLLHG